MVAIQSVMAGLGSMPLRLGTVRLGTAADKWVGGKEPSSTDQYGVARHDRLDDGTSGAAIWALS